ncbi:MAG: hypothetical protein Ta2B_20040 [Termitinemataceae bacterium]|nr:MAG: hypothetical protein Ta2B_20040 [Termitinemataceae bacterium]
MWQRVQSVIAILCIVVYAGAASFAVHSVYTGVRSQQAASVKEFQALKDFAVRASVLGFLNKQFQDDIKNQLALSKTLQGVIISGGGGNNFAVEKFSGTISYTDRDPIFKKQLRLSKDQFSEKLNVEGVPNASISAVASVIDYNKLLYILRTSLLAILIAAVISFSTLILDVAVVRHDSDYETEDSGYQAANKIDDSTAFKTVPRADTNSDDESESDFDDSLQKSFNFDDDYNSESTSFDDLIIDENNTKSVQAELKSGNDTDAESDVDIEEILPEKSSEPPKNSFSFDKISLDEIVDEPTPFDDLISNEPINLCIDDKKETEQQQEQEQIISEHELADDDDFTTIDMYDAIVAETDQPKPIEEEHIAKEPSASTGLLAAAAKLSEDADTFYFEEDEYDENIVNILKPELESAALQDKDLTVLSCELAGLSADYSVLTATAKKYFLGDSIDDSVGYSIGNSNDGETQDKSNEKSKTAIIEKENGGLFIVLSDVAIDDGFARAKEFHRLYNVEKQPESDCTLLLGLAARTDRNIVPQRLIHESDRALEKAREDQSLPIVAFKVDSQKYKELESKNQV